MAISIFRAHCLPRRRHAYESLFPEPNGILDAVRALSASPLSWGLALLWFGVANVVALPLHCWVQYDVPLYDELYASVISFGACACVAGRAFQSFPFNSTHESAPSRDIEATLCSSLPRVERLEEIEAFALDLDTGCTNRAADTIPRTCGFTDETAGSYGFTDETAVC